MSIIHKEKNPHKDKSYKNKQIFICTFHAKIGHSLMVIMNNYKFHEEGTKILDFCQQ